MKGFCKKIIRINLTTQEIRQEPLDPSAAQHFIGGSGLAAYYYHHFLTTQKEPPQPFECNNPLYILTGALTGLPAYCTARTSICSRSPLTTIWGESNVGGHFGATLKFAGYDGIIITGKSDHPVNLTINDSEIRLQDATTYWGMNTYKLIEQLPKTQEKPTKKKPQILTIGPAGEHLVPYAAIMTSGGRTAGRTGMGAVMGSKNLKAIMVSGSGSTKQFDLPEEFITTAKESLHSVQDDFIFGLFKDLGTAGYADVALDMYGDMPIKNWSQGLFEGENEISGSNMAEKLSVSAKACFRCPIGCGREIIIPKGEYQLPQIDGPEYETLAAFGTNLLINDLEAVAYANYKANDLGLDTISTGAVIGVYFDLIEKGYIPPEDQPDECSCGYNNPKALFYLIEKIAQKQGIGALLAQGSKKLSEHYNHPELAPHVLGLEAPYHDPRAFSTMAISYLTSPRGACHLNSDAYLSQQGQIFPKVGVDDLPDDRFSDTGIAPAVVALQNYRQLYNAMGVCQFYNPPAPYIATLLGIAIGKTLSPQDLNLIGERLYTIKRLINLKVGWKKEWEKLPQVMLQKLEGPTEGNVPDTEIQLGEWYQQRDYNYTTGIPSSQVLEKTGLTTLLNRPFF